VCAGEGALVGFPALPAPDDGDLFLDYEGHPFWHADAGLFFLFGFITRDEGGAWVYEARWAHDREDEARLTKGFIDDLVGRQARHPDMHVYHYNHTERSSLERLAADHGVEKIALARLVETGLFIDLLPVVTNSMQVGVESYGLKHIELLAGFERSHDIDKGAGAVVEYEAWMGDQDPGRLTRIARYNEDDVRATLALRDWLLTERRADLPWRPAQFEPPESTYPEIDAQVEALHAYPPNSAHHLLGGLLGYWLREAHAVFGGMIAKTCYDDAAQLDDPEMLAGLELIERELRPTNNGGYNQPRMRFRFPTQRLGRKLRDGSGVIFAVTDQGVNFSTIGSIDTTARTVALAWSPKCDESAVIPTAVVVNDWVNPSPKPEALSRLAGRLLADDSPDGPPRTRPSAI
jgi:hypothetical protein